MVNLSPSVLSFLKGLGLSLLTALLGFLSVSANLQAIIPAQYQAIVIPIIVGLVAQLESSFNKNTGKALFGIARAR